MALYVLTNEKIILIYEIIKIYNNIVNGDMKYLFNAHLFFAVAETTMPLYVTNYQYATGILTTGVLIYGLLSQAKEVKSTFGHITQFLDWIWKVCIDSASHFINRRTLIPSNRIKVYHLYKIC